MNASFVLIYLLYNVLPPALYWMYVNNMSYFHFSFVPYNMDKTFYQPF